MNGDITYCVANCSNKTKCFRNPENRPFKDMPYSISDFSDICNKFEEPKDEDR
ncbi:MAG: hypothetical protein IJH55_09390 [Romboutsia sp.]|nr:hypothetical protein [Romboutsia sp.]